MKSGTFIFFFLGSLSMVWLVVSKLPTKEFISCSILFLSLLFTTAVISIPQRLPMISG